jgi:hypothetical protein
MTSPALLSLRANILANVLTAGQQAALVDALDLVTPTFPQPDQLDDSIPVSEEILARDWFAALYTIQAEGAGGGPPVVAVNTILAADGPALSALSVASFPNAQPAVVESFGAEFSLQPIDGMTVDGSTVLATLDDPARVWERGDTVVAEQSVIQPAWFVDAATGNNNNTGKTSGTAVKEFIEIERRWGTSAPRIAQDTVITIIGDDLQTAILFEPTIDLGAHLTIQGQPTLTATTTLAGAGFQAKDTATGAQLHANLGASGATGQLLINVTHPSHAWAKESLGADVFVISQPITANASAMVDTWAPTDTVQLFTLPRVNFALLRPSFTETTLALDNLVALKTMVVADPVGPGFDAFQTGPYFNMTDVRMERFWAPEPGTWNSGLAMFHINCAFDGSITVLLSSRESSLINLLGGYILGVNFQEIALGGMVLDGGIILDGSTLSAVSFSAGGCRFENVNILGPMTVTDRILVPIAGGYGPSILWGSGAGWSADVNRLVSIIYKTASAVATFVGLSVSGLTIAQQADANSETIAGSVATIHTGIPITPANLDAAAGVAGFGGTAFLLGGGTITNIGGG